MSVTLETSRLPIGWLKAAFHQNMYHMSVTLETFHSPIGWLTGSLFPRERPQQQPAQDHVCDARVLPAADRLVEHPK